MERRSPDDGGGRRLYDVAQVASMLDVKESFVRRLVTRHRIPFYKIGKFIRFDPEEVWTWVQDGRGGLLP